VIAFSPRELLATKGNHRIYLHRATGGKIAGQQGDADEKTR